MRNYSGIFYPDTLYFYAFIILLGACYYSFIFGVQTTLLVVCTLLLLFLLANKLID